MKLRQIIKEQIDHRVVTTRKPNRQLYKNILPWDQKDGDDAMKPDEKRLGQGRFSVVYPDDEDPHMVKKLGRDKGNIGKIQGHYVKDRFVEYAKWIVDGKLWETSVHFPRIYVTEYDEANDIHDFTIEKLQPYKVLSVEALVGLFKKYFTKKAIHEWVNTYGVDTSSLYELQDALSDLLNVTLGDMLFHNIKDEGLLKTVKIIDAEMRNHKGDWKYDIHEDNLMYRLTGSGPQLVLIDIIYNDE